MAERLQCHFREYEFVTWGGPGWVGAGILVVLLGVRELCVLCLLERFVLGHVWRASLVTQMQWNQCKPQGFYSPCDGSLEAT